MYHCSQCHPGAYAVGLICFLSWYQSMKSCVQGRPPACYGKIEFHFLASKHCS
uniref:Uncharacterized protein n=1 Tax=Rhizophora mucronata TaxID=61149 RepID=A0A2P2QNJ2_RHIMU